MSDHATNDGERAEQIDQPAENLIAISFRAEEDGRGVQLLVRAGGQTHALPLSDDGAAFLIDQIQAAREKARRLDEARRLW